MNDRNFEELCALAPLCAPIDEDCAVILLAIMAKKELGEPAEFSADDFCGLIRRSKKRASRCVKKLVSDGYITRDPCEDGLRHIYDIGEAVWNYNEIAKKCLEQIKSVLGEDDETMYGDEHHRYWIQNQ